MARPQLQRQNKRRHDRKIRFSDEELERIRFSANSSGMPVATFIRNAALGVNINAKPTRISNNVIRELNGLGNNLNQLSHNTNLAKNIGDTKFQQIMLEQAKNIEHVLARITTTIIKLR